MSGLIILGLIILLILLNAFIYELFDDFTLVRFFRNSAGGIMFIFGLVKIIDFSGFVSVFQNCFGKNVVNKLLGTFLPFLEFVLGMLFILNVFGDFVIYVVFGFSIFSIFVSFLGLTAKSDKDDEKCMSSFVKLPLSLINFVGYGLVLVLSMGVMLIS